MLTPPNATATFNTIDRLFRLITWTALTGAVFIAYQKSGDWPKLALLAFMGTMLVIGTLCVAVLVIGSVATATPLARSPGPARLLFYTAALLALTALAFGLTSAIHTLVLRL